MTDDRLAATAAREYPHRSGTIHLNAASWGLIPLGAAREAAELTLRRNRADGFAESEFGPIQRRARAAVSALVGGDEDEVALCPNTTYGVGLAVALVAAGPRGSVVVSRGEFPANVLPWRRLEPLGFELRFVDTRADGLPDEDALVAALAAPAVRAFALSAVQYATGYRHDLDRFGRACREHGVLFCVDGIQALGAVPLDPRAAAIDVLAAGGQKWLCSAWGSGFVWMDRKHHERVEPPLASWLGVRGGGRLEGSSAYALDWVRGARRFEVATLGYQDVLTLARSLEILREVGVDRIEAHLRALHEPLLRWIGSRPDVRLLTPADPAHRAGIVSFRADAADAMSRALTDARVTHSVRDGFVRLAPHWYNTGEEMERVVALLDRVH